MTAARPSKVLLKCHRALLGEHIAGLPSRVRAAADECRHLEDALRELIAATDEHLSGYCVPTTLRAALDAARAALTAAGVTP